MPPLEADLFVRATAAVAARAAGVGASAEDLVAIVRRGSAQAAALQAAAVLAHGGEQDGRSQAHAQRSGIDAGTLEDAWRTR